MTHKILGDLETKTDYLIPNRKLDLVLINKNKRTCHLLDFVILADNKVKIKENKKIDKYLGISRELKKPNNLGTWGWRGYQL